MARVHDEPDQAKVWVGQVVLQKPRECLPFLFSLIALLLVLPSTLFWGITDFIAPVIYGGKFAQFLKDFHSSK